MSISSLSKVVSGLMANEIALNTTAHNLANANTPGYVRQQVLMKESYYTNIGHSGTSAMSLGMGTDIQVIRQVRDIFLDKAYREENGRLGFYDSQASAVEEVEIILGEIEGESFSKILDNLWISINELAKHPDGLETRGSFVQSAVMFVDRANLIMEQLSEYQDNLNTKIETSVSRINTIGKEIYKLNDVIVKQELSGGNANDYRDRRNSLLDELSSLVNISYREDKYGNVLVQAENVPFVTLSGATEIGLREAVPFSNLKEPYWVSLDTPLFNLDTTIAPEYNNDKGTLKGLLLARGTKQANYTDMANAATYETEIKPSIIMNAQAQFDNLIHGIVTMINDILSPSNPPVPPSTVPTLDAANAPYGLDGSQGIELFKRISMDRYSDTVEDPANEYSLYSAGNLEINPEILSDYDKLCLSKVLGEKGDNQIVADIIRKWDEPFSPLEPSGAAVMNFRDYYNSYVSEIGNVGSVANNQRTNQNLMATQIDNQRSSLTGVSSDEELSNMMKYQHAYNASARVVTVVDQMIEQIVTSLGIVGR